MFNDNYKERITYIVYIVWENDEVSSLSDSKNDEIVDLCLMGHKHHDVIHYDSNFDLNSSYEELQKALIDMNGDAINP